MPFDYSNDAKTLARAEEQIAEAVADIAPTVYPDNDNWERVTRNDAGQVIYGVKKDGSTWGGRNGNYEKLYDPADMDQAKADIADLMNGASSDAKPNTLRDLVNDLGNPLTDVCIVIAGASVEWGLTLPENSASTPRNNSLSDPRNNFDAPSYVNVLTKWIANAALDLPDGYAPVIGNAPGSTTGGMATYSDPYQFIDPRYNKYVKVYSADGIELEKIGNKVGTATSGANVPSPLEIPAGCYAEFQIRGDNFELMYGTTVVGGDFEIIFDGSSLGEVSYTGAVSWGNLQPVSSLPVGLHTVQVWNRGAAGFRLEQIKRTKIFRMVNQGIIGSGTNQWRPDSTWHFSTSCLTPDASYAIINLGSNDRSATNLNPINVTRVKEYKRDIIRYFASQGVKSILGGSAPISLDFPNEGSTAKFSQLQIGRINKELAEEEGVSYVDRYVRSVQGRLDGTWEDGVAPGGDNHPNELGHKWLAQSYIDTMIEYFDA